MQNISHPFCALKNVIPKITEQNNMKWNELYIGHYQSFNFERKNMTRSILVSQNYFNHSAVMLPSTLPDED